MHQRIQQVPNGVLMVNQVNRGLEAEIEYSASTGWQTFASVSWTLAIALTCLLSVFALVSCGIETYLRPPPRPLTSLGLLAVD